MGNPSLTQSRDPWSLLAKAETRCKLGLFNEAVIIADETAQAEIAAYLDRLGIPLPVGRKVNLQVLGEGIGVPTKSLLRLGELRGKAEQIAEDVELTAFDAEEAISIAENLVTNISERNERLALESVGTEFATPTRTLNSVKQVRSLREDARQFETEFVTKLLLTKAILGSKKKGIPHFIGSTITILSALACLFFGLMGGSGIILALTGRSLLSISGLVVNFLFLLIAYLCLKVTVHVRGETR